MIQTIRNKLRLVLLSSGVPLSHWAPITKFAVQDLVNLHVRNGYQQKAFERFHGASFDGKMLRSIGVRAYLLNKGPRTV